MTTTQSNKFSIARAQKLLDKHDWEKSIELQIENDYIYPLGKRHYVAIHKGNGLYDWSYCYMMSYIQTISYLCFDNAGPNTYVIKDYLSTEENEIFNPLEHAKCFASQHIDIIKSLSYSKYKRERTDYFSGDYSIKILNPDRIKAETANKEFYIEITYGWDYVSKKWYGGFYVMLPSKGVTGCTGHGRSCEFVYENKLHGVYDTPGFSSKQQCIEYYINKTTGEMHGVSMLMEKYREDIEKIFPNIFNELTAQLNKYLPHEKQKGQTCLF